MFKSLMAMIAASIAFIILVLFIIVLVKKAIDLYTKKKYGKSREQMEYKKMSIKDL